MKILLLHNYFHPEAGSAPHLLHELGGTLVERGHQVTVVTGFPRYNLPALPEKYRRRLFFREAMDGMKVLRINAPNFYGTSKFSRGMVQLLAPPVLMLRALPVERPDVIHTLTPSIFMGKAARVVAARFRVPYVVAVQDLFPQCMVDAGVLRNPALIRFFERAERSVYRHADGLTAMSDGNRDHILARGGDPDRVFTVPNWVDSEQVQPGDRMNEFRRKHNLGDDFIVLAAGTMGFFQGLEVVVEAARHLADKKGLLFLLVGDGAEREKLGKLSEGLPNVRFLPMQPQEVYPQVLAASDAGLSTLRPEVATPVVPSKICTIMSAGRPVLGALPPGDAPQLVSDAECGTIVPAGDARALAEAVMALKENPDMARRMGANGRSYVEEHLSRQVCVGKVERLLEHVIRRRQGDTGSLDLG